MDTVEGNNKTKNIIDNKDVVTTDEQGQQEYEFPMSTSGKEKRTLTNNNDLRPRQQIIMSTLLLMISSKLGKRALTLSTLSLGNWVCQRTLSPAEPSKKITCNLKWSQMI